MEFLRRFLLLLTFHDFAAFSFILLSFIGMILLGSQVLLLNSFNEAIIQSTFVTREYGGMNSIIRRTNSKLATLNKIEQEFVPWSTIFLSVAKTIPPNISLSSLTVEKSGGNLLIQGIAKNRNDLLNFTKLLEGSSLFEFVESPLSNLLIKEDIAFELKAKLSISSIKNRLELQRKRLEGLKTPGSASDTLSSP